MQSNNGSPEGAMQSLRYPCAALSGLSAIWTLNPGLAPWAVLLDPSGSLVSRQKLTRSGESPQKFLHAFSLRRGDRLLSGNLLVLASLHFSPNELGLLGCKTQ